LTSRLYLDNSAQGRSLWVNQGTLKSYDVGGRKDSDVTSQSVFDVSPRLAERNGGRCIACQPGSETADYVVSVEGGDAHKVADVAPTYGFAQVQ
jgi:hypothetical protein